MTALLPSLRNIDFVLYWRDNNPPSDSTLGNDSLNTASAVADNLIDKSTKVARNWLVSTKGPVKECTGWLKV